jgi:hypothetical protein
MKSEIKQLAVTSIKPNPFRQLETYPWVDDKIATLRKSMADKDVGMWESVIARKKGNSYELAFGHHRLEAAKREGFKRIPVIVKDLTDAQMIKYMGRENGEDYNTDFLIMLNTWEGALTYISGQDPDHDPQAIEIARFLGWTRERKDRGGDNVTATAAACSTAHSLIQDAHLKRSDLEGLSVDDVEKLTGRTKAAIDRINKQKRPVAERKAAIKHVERGAKITARAVKAGDVPSKKIPVTVEREAYDQARAAKKQVAPLFEAFGRRLISNIEKMLAEDSVAEKLDQVVKAIPSLQLEEDKDTVDALNYHLGKLSDRALRYQKAMIPTKKKVTQLKAIGGNS